MKVCSYVPFLAQYQVYSTELQERGRTSNISRVLGTAVVGGLLKKKKIGSAMIAYISFPLKPKCSTNKEHQEKTLNYTTERDRERFRCVMDLNGSLSRVRQC